jgi:hypothetical protein
MEILDVGFWILDFGFSGSDGSQFSGTPLKWQAKRWQTSIQNLKSKVANCLNRTSRI